MDSIYYLPDCSADINTKMVIAEHGIEENMEVNQIDSEERESETELEGKFVPSLDMEFQSIEDGHQFYKNYGFLAGFGTKKRSGTRSRQTGELCTYYVGCKKYGSETLATISSLKRRHEDIRTGCKAHMRLSKRKDGMWVVSAVNLKHNHQCFPKFSSCFRSHKVTPPAQISKNVNLNAAGVGNSTAYAFHDGLSDSDKQELHNAVDIENRDRLKLGDANCLFQYFQSMHEKDFGFYFMIDTDEDGCLRRIFWVDSRCRKDYGYFGDVVSFDSTYITNRHNMPFAPFVGVNHHGQTSLFGCGLLLDDTKASYVWLFQQWLKAMDGKTPKTILTDQDGVISAAAKEVFPNTVHRFCLWHIYQKLSSKLDHIGKDPAFEKLWNKCIYKAMTEEQFENMWAKMVQEFDFGEDKWICDLYQQREKWVPVFLKNTCFAGMNTKQRSKSTNSFLDKYIKRSTTLLEFVKQYRLALERCCSKEDKENFASLNEAQLLITKCRYEKQFEAYFTRNMFFKVQVEVQRIEACNMISKNVEGQVTSFIVREDVDNKPGQQKAEDFHVTWDAGKEEVNCICRCFEFRGFLCGHAMFVFKLCGVLEIPLKYMLRRWSKELYEKHKTESVSSKQKDALDDEKARFDFIRHKALLLARKAAISKETTLLASNVMDDLLQKYDGLNRTSLEPQSVDAALSVTTKQSVERKKTPRKEMCNA